MAKRKGKSEHRVRDWDRRFVGGERVEDETSSRQRLTQRKVKIPTLRLLTPEENLEYLPNVEGMVIGVFPGGVVVRVAEVPGASDRPEPVGRAYLPDNSTEPVGRATLPDSPANSEPASRASTPGLQADDLDAPDILCGIAKTFRAPPGATPLAVGDLVTVALARQGGGQFAAALDRADDKVRADGMVLARRPRKSALCRPQITSGKRHDEFEHEAIDKVIVANMDTMVIVASTTSPPLRPGPIDRFLIVAERGELAPVLAVNKIDLAAPEEEVMEGFRTMGVRIVLCSARTGEGMAELRGLLAGRQSVLAGASGVGKSTLINALVPGAGAVTREIRSKDDRGRHTTSAASVYDLPGGGRLIDTPGIREIGIRISADVLPWFFPEFEPFLPACKYRNCTHTHEPDCAVQAAVEAGQIPARRFESYLRILASLGE